MNSRYQYDVQQVRAFHEQTMVEGQRSYFAVDPHGELTPKRSQRHWIDIHQRKIARLLALEQDEVFVDLGCGEGYLTQSLASQAGLSLGLDFSMGALHVLKGRPSFDASQLQLALALGDDLPIAAASVDKLLCNHMLEHVIDDRAVVRSVRRVLRPAGRAVIGVPLAFTPQTRLLMRLRRLLSPQARRLQLESVAPGQLARGLIGTQSHIRFYSLDAISTLLERHGFRVLRAEGIGFALRGPVLSRLSKNPLVLRLGTAVGRIAPSLGDGVLVLAERL